MKHTGIICAKAKTHHQPEARQMRVSHYTLSLESFLLSSIDVPIDWDSMAPYKSAERLNLSEFPF